MFYNDQNSSPKQTTMVIMNIDDLREAFKAWNQEQIEANSPQEEIYITAKEAAKMLGVTLSTLCMGGKTKSANWEWRFLRCNELWAMALGPYLVEMGEKTKSTKTFTRVYICFTSMGVIRGIKGVFLYMEIKKGLQTDVRRLFLCLEASGCRWFWEMIRLWCGRSSRRCVECMGDVG